MRPFGIAALVLAAGCASFGVASSDTTPPTSADAADAAADAGAEAGPSVCPALAFCDDFERSAGLVGPWELTEVTGDAALTISTVQRTSGTRSLFVSLPARATDDRVAFLLHTVQPAAGRLTVSFSLFVEVAPASGDVLVAELGTTTGHAFVLLREARLVILGQTKPTNATGPDASVDITLGRWHRIAFELAPSELRLTLDGTPTKTPLIQGAGTVSEVQVGATYAAAGAAASYFIDDVAIERGP